MRHKAVFLEHAASVPSKLFERLGSESGDDVPQLCRITDLGDLDDTAKRQRPVAVIINWSSCANPYLVVEMVLQHPELSRLPTVVAYERIEQEGLTFLSEYAVTYLVPLTSNLQVGCKRILALLAADGAVTQPSAQTPAATRSFFHHLHNGRFTEAEAVLEGATLKRAPEADRVYLHGIVLKTQKRFDDAVRYLASGLQLTRKDRNLAPHFLHLIGNVYFKRQEYDQARRFLEAAHKVSPRNLRRRFLLAQLYFECNEHAEALAAYEALFRECPAYPGIHFRMIELILKQAKTEADVERAAFPLRHLQVLQLVRLYKSIEESAAAPAKRLLGLIVQEFYRHADQAIQADDFYGALGYYQRVKKLLPSKDPEAVRELIFRCAELHVRAAEPVQAQKYVDILVKNGTKGARLDELCKALSGMTGINTNAS